jgi:hypothetical protein
MPTGACGVNCDTCGLNVSGACSSCGPGTSVQGRKKMSVQKRILGTACPVLACAEASGVDYCLRDCDRFPCHAFKSGPYPFSQGFLMMQERRRSEPLDLQAPSGNRVKVPSAHWEDLGKADPGRVCRNAGARPGEARAFLLPFLGEDLLIDVKSRTVSGRAEDGWKGIENDLLELVSLVYLLSAGPQSPTGELVSFQELQTAHFFTGPHAIRTRPLVDRFGQDLEGFRAVAERLGGHSMGMADGAYRFLVFPKVPLHYLLWVGDDEFQATFSILFDRSIEQHLPADAIWAMVNLVTSMLLQGGKRRLTHSPKYVAIS